MNERRTKTTQKTLIDNIITDSLIFMIALDTSLKIISYLKELGLMLTCSAP